MLKFRERTNTWPGFVDLFSNLVIILIFLLIVFVFLWTTTSVFNSKSGVKKVADLTRLTTEQAETIANMAADDEESKRLLVLARSELETSAAAQAQLAAQRDQLEADLAAAAVDMATLQSETENSLDELTAAYRAQLDELTANRDEMQNMVKILTEQLNVLQAENNQESAAAQNLTLEIARLNAALDAAEAKARAQEVEYLEMSNRLNRAMADRIAEMNEYQSHFYAAVKAALMGADDIVIDGDRFIIPSDILFASGKYTLTTAGKQQIQKLATVIRDLEARIPTDVKWIIRVDGHTDNRAVIPGTEKTRGYKNNTELSLLRATAVTNELIKSGVSKRRVVPSGFGEMHPTELGTDAATLQKNRRIELRLTNP